MKIRPLGLRAFANLSYDGFREAGAKAKPKAKGKAKQKSGPKTMLFKKCSWGEVSTRYRALTLVTRLRLTADDFHGH